MNTLSLTEAFEKFALLGAEWVMWVLVVMGLVAFGLFFVRLYFLRKYRVEVPRLLDSLTATAVQNMVGENPKGGLEALSVGRTDAMELEVAQQVLAHWQLSESGLENVVQKTILS
ncbi:MAG: hypothetical protein ACPGQS_03535, partial [Bradymonadia bacterium]